MAMSGVNKAGIGVAVLGAVALGVGLADLRFKMISKAAMIALTSAGGTAMLVGLGMATAHKRAYEVQDPDNTTIAEYHMFGIKWIKKQIENQEVKETPAYVTDLFAFAKQHQGEELGSVANALVAAYADKGGKVQLLEHLNSDAFTTFCLRDTNVFTDNWSKLLIAVKGYLEADNVQFD